MGRSRIPAQLQTGHLTSAQKTIKKQQDAAIKTTTPITKTPPKWISDPVARAEWRRVVPMLMEIDVIGGLDVASLAGYVNAFAKYRTATENLDGQPLVLISANTGNAYANPLIKVQSDYAAEMRKFADLCGLTISSRLKAAATKTAKTDDRITQDFGDI